MEEDKQAEYASSSDSDTLAQNWDDREILGCWGNLLVGSSLDKPLKIPQNSPVSWKFGLPSNWIRLPTVHTYEFLFCFFSFMSFVITVTEITWASYFVYLCISSKTLLLSFSRIYTCHVLY